MVNSFYYRFRSNFTGHSRYLDPSLLWLNFPYTGPTPPTFFFCLTQYPKRCIFAKKFGQSILSRVGYLFEEAQFQEAQ